MERHIEKSTSKRFTGKKYWKLLASSYGGLCAYCGEELAVTIDHIIPFSYSLDNSPGNLCPSCLWCNLHAGDKTFPSFEAKQQFIRERRRQGGRDIKCRTVCVTCFLPFQRPHMTSSMFQCPLCDPTKVGYRQKEAWNRFEIVLKTAGVRLDFHARIRERMLEDPYKGARAELGEMYAEALLAESNDELSSTLHYWHTV